MFGTIKTLIAGSNARAEETLRQVYSIELIEQKIREAQDGLKLAKHTLASLIQRERSEGRQIAALETRAADLLHRAQDAVNGGRDDLAQEAAQAIADMENEIAVRKDTVSRLETRIMRLRASVDTSNRRIIDLKQGAIAARAVQREHSAQSRLNRSLSSNSAMEEAEELIGNVLKRDDPLEQSEILKEIDSGLNHDTVADRMAAQGFGPASKATASDVLSRLKTK